MSPSQKVMTILNGPNLNLLGQRETDIYGKQTLADVEEACKQEAERNNVTVAFYQSNHEGVLIDHIHAARENSFGLIINPGAFAHRSIALYDALLCCAFPIIEVHISNVHKRESFRHELMSASVADGVICGLGSEGYIFALKYLCLKK